LRLPSQFLKHQLLPQSGLSLRLLAGLLTPVVGFAQTWDGGAGTGNWSDAVNWSADAVPSSGAAVAFAGAVQTTINTQVNRSVSTLTFSAGASAFTLVPIPEPATLTVLAGAGVLGVAIWRRRRRLA
jgi:hypothetical protein